MPNTNSSVRNSIMELIGKVPEDKKAFTHLMRLHQGWWRTVVLMEEPGKHPIHSRRGCL